MASNLWIAVGSGGNTIATSTNGTTWSGLSNTIFSSIGNGVENANNLIVVVGSGGNTIATSSDGVTWVGRGSSVFTSYGYEVAYGNGLWVAVGYGNNSIATSTDGIIWTGRGSSVLLYGSGVTYGNGLWVAIGGGTNTIATSTDGITWTGRGASVITNQGYGVTYANGLWVASGRGANTIATSTNGIVWTGRGTSIFSVYGYGAAYANGLWVATGQGGNTIATSVDGITWTGRGSSVFTSAGARITNSNNLWVAGGAGGNTLATSSDGINWTGLGNIVFTNNYDIASPFKFAPTIIFTIPLKNIGDAPFTMALTSNSTGLITYTSSNLAVATIDGSTMTIVGMGTSTITAVQASTDSFFSATTTATLTVENVKATLADFTAITKTFGDASFSIVAPTTNSDGAFTYTSSNTAVATVAGSTITIVSVGTSTITASQSNTIDYGSAAITTPLTVNKATPSITNFSEITKTFGNAAFSLVAPTSNSTGAFTYTSSNTAVATIAGSTVTIVGGGTATITANQASTANYLAGTITATMTVSQATPTITNFSVPAKVTENVPFTIVNPTSNSSGAFTYTSSDTLVATIDGSMVTIVGKGTSTITASQASTTNYVSGSITATFIVRLTPIITNFTAITKTFADASFSIVAPTTDSDGTFTYTSSNTAVATVSGSRITIVSTGTSTITATQSLTSNYVSGTITTSLTVNKATPTITNFSAITKTFGNAAFNLVAPTSNSTGAFTYTSSNTAVATVAGSTVTIVGGGTATITASQATTANYLAETIAATMTVSQATPTITKFDIPAKAIGTAPFIIAPPTSNSSGAFTYTSSDTSVATIDGSMVTIIGVGNTTITAVQASTTNYLDATTTGILAIMVKVPLSIAVGQGGNSIATSTDLGITWTGRGAHFSTSGYDVAGPATYDVSTASVGLYISGPGLRRSADGTNWTNSQFSILNNNSIYGSIESGLDGSGNVIFIATGQNNNGLGNTIATTTDGVTWTGRGLAGFNGQSGFASGIAFGKDGAGNNLWVVTGRVTTNTMGEGNCIASSSDGYNWVVRNSTIFNYSGGNGVAFGKDGGGNNLWVAVGHGDTAYATSTNGTSWTGRTISGITNGQSVVFGKDASGGNLWIILSPNASNSIKISKSSDGYNWTTQIILNYQIPTGIAFGKDGSGVNLWAIICTLSNNASVRTVIYSYDTTTWVNANVVGMSGDGRKVSYVNNRWFACTLYQYSTSTNGTTWNTVQTDKISYVAYGTFTYTKPTYVVVGQGYDNTIVDSTNGTTWRASVTTPFTNAGYGVAWNGTQWVAVGSDTNTIAYSADGLIWTGNSTFSTQGNDVAYGKDSSGNGLWVAAGQGGHSLATSTNGITWTGRTGTTIFTNSGLCVAFGKDGSGNNLLVAVGQGGNTIATSTNGTTWTGRGATIFTTQGIGVTYANNRWIAVGSGGNSIATSTNGTAWTGLGTSVFTTKGNDIRYTNNLWVATGQGGANTIATSVNGTTWVGRGSTVFTNAGQDVLGPTTAEPTIIFTIPLRNIGDAPFTMVPPISNSKGAFTYTSSNSEVATIDGNTMTIVGMGTSTITAVQESTDFFISGTTTTTLTVENVKPVVTDFVVPAKTFGDAAFSIVAPTSNSDGIFSYTSSNTAVATIDGSTITVVGGGTSTISAYQAITSDYGSAIITASFEVSRATTVLTGFSEITKTFGDASFSIVTPTTNRDGAFIYTSSNTAVATITGSRITIIGGGTATITASQLITSNYTSGTITATLTVNKATTVLSNFSAITKTFGNAAFNLVAPTTNSNGAFTYTSSNTAVATIEGSTVTIVGAGTATITASQATTTNYLAETITTTMTVSQATPSITIFDVPAKAIGTAPFIIDPPISNSSGAFTYTSSDTSVATIDGSMVTVVGLGNTTITAVQPSTTNYLSGSITGILSIMVIVPLSIAVGQGGNSIATSTDRGLTWTGRTGTTVFSTSGSCVAFGKDGSNNNFLVAVGQGGNTITTSTNGTTWIGRGASVFTTQGIGVAYANNLWVAVGKGANSIATSSDGIVWTGRTGTSIFSNQGIGVAFNNGLWVAVGDGTSNSIATSPDGVVWTGRGKTSLSGWGRGIAYGNGLWVAVGKGTNSIATSPNGVTWTGRTGTSIFSNEGMGVAFNNGLWVAVGDGTSNTIATSTDGIVWTGRGKTALSGLGRSVAFNTGLWVAVGQGTNSIATSLDGVVWTGRTGTSIFSTSGLGAAVGVIITPSVINSISPSSGAIVGGTSVTITGANFTGATSLTFDGIAATSFTIVNSNTITCITPARSAGAVGIIVTNGGGPSDAFSSFTYIAPPVISSISPPSGSTDGETNVTITGTNFTGATLVTFGGLSATSLSIVNSTTITCITPARSVGAVGIIVTTIYGTSNTFSPFTYIRPPVISSISLPSGSTAGGTNVTITGTNFTGATSVTFDGLAATTINVVNSTTITCITPAHSVGAVDIIVTTGGGPSGPFSSFTYITPPSITDISPSSGGIAGGMNVTITGTNFTGATLVTFGVSSATAINVVNSTTITCITPARSAGAIGIIVTTGGGPSSAFSSFTYISPPNITGISPSSGSTAGGTSVTLTGTSFTGANLVTFGGLTATSLSVVNSTTITCITPTRSSGAVGIIVRTIYGTSGAFSSFTYITPPVISRISPSFGGIAGGTNVTITGKNFTGATLVTFGGSAATSLSIVNSTTITCITPVNSDGTVGIIVTTGGGPSNTFSSFTYITPSSITNISPSSGSTEGGTSVTITGTNFTGATSVTFDGIAATSLNIVNSTTITCITPARSAGAVGIIVTNGGGPSSEFSSFAYITPPVISSISSSSGSTLGGTNVTITGTNFTGATLVTFDGLSATSLNIVNSTTITCITPARTTAGAVGIIVTTGGGPSGAFSSFTYILPPNITGISPSSGSTEGVTSVTITGTSFTGATTVTFDGLAATSLSVVNSTTITCIAPAHSVGAVGIIVTTEVGSSGEFSSFTYITSPVISSISPSSGGIAGGTSVTLTGINFTGATSITFDGIAATSLSIVNSTTITCITPAHSAGAVGIIVTNGGGPSDAFSSFTYITPPSITDISPSSGVNTGGTSVTITGTNFTGATSVTFGGIAATSLTVVDSTTITCITPAVNSDGDVGIIVTTEGGPSSEFSSFTYITPPVISSISPSSGSTVGETSVTITGKNFTGASSVTFDGLSATSLIILNSTTITCITPARTTAGDVGIIVTAEGGPSSEFSSFTYITPPNITEISPSSGSTLGGTNVTITGTNFTGATSVTFNDLAATTINVVNSTTITCITPDHDAGDVDIIVTTEGGPSDAFSSFTYITPPSITDISPSSGSTAGGTRVTITGTSFIGATSVTFDGLAATSLSIVDSTTITCITPAHDAGDVDIIVTTIYGTSNTFSPFTYVTSPYITGISLLTGSTAGGTNVTITGTNFTGATSVTFDGLDATTINVVDSTTITCITPAHNAGAVGIIVITDGGPSGEFSSFTYITPPNITGISPSTGSTAGGTSVTITGTSFTGETSVTFDGLAATTINVVNSTTITCVTPAHNAGAVGIIVTSEGIPSSEFSSFTYITPPNITGILPSSGSILGGTNVTITGTNFTGATSVTFDGLAATTINVVNSTTITCITPAHNTGDVGIIVTTGGGPSSEFSSFTYITPPNITSISPLTGSTAGGTSVTITGTNFTGATLVTFGGVAATSLSIVDSTTITCITPARATAGAVGVIVTTGGGPSNTFASFTYILPPNIKSMTPSSVSRVGGTTVTITGTNFIGATSVTFDGLSATSLNVVSNTSITCITPARTTGGTVGVIVTTGGGPSNTFSTFIYVPFVSAILPTFGTQSGGTAVKITGIAFTGATSVTFGGIPATNVFVFNPTTITCRTPAGIAAGAVGVIVSTRDGPSNTFSSFTYITPPNITGISPSYGGTVGGSIVTITGKSFTGVSSVLFGGLKVKSLRVIDDTTIICVTAARTTPGNVDITVQNSIGISNVFSSFTYIITPTIKSISPTFGSTTGGNTVTVTGTDFTGATEVTVGDISCATITVIDNNTLTCITPARIAPGPVGIIVTTGGGSTKKSSPFTYILPPVITSISPPFGGTTGGNVITITGLNFKGASTVLFGGLGATLVKAVNDTTITCKTPVTLTAGPVDVIVRTGGGPSNTFSSFMYITPPVISNILPPAGNKAGGNIVTITGTNFTGATSVLFGKAASTNITVVDDTTLTCRTPINPAGAFGVIVRTGGGPSNTFASFTFVTPASISSILPLSGSTNGGTFVTIKGKDFIGATSLTIDGVEATSFTVVNATLITCITPSRPTSGGVGIIVTTAGGPSKQFSFYNYITPPVITSLSPSSGSIAGGTIVTIRGTNFTGASSVTIDGKAATPIKVVDNTTITCKAPVSLSAGPVDVIVTTGGGPSSAFSSYTYITPAVITSISPSFGTKAGGTSVTITGTNFTGTSVVLFGLKSATNINVVDNTTITCVTPDSTSAVAVGVTLTTGAGLSNKFSSFTYR